MLSEGGGKIESSTSGHFKADASLSATFGQVHCGRWAVHLREPSRPTCSTTVTGTIDNFTLSGGEAQDWSVNLARGAITTGTGIHDRHGRRWWSFRFLQRYIPRRP